jgi:hypothetical protein
MADFAKFPPFTTIQTPREEKDYTGGYVLNHESE